MRKMKDSGIEWIGGIPDNWCTSRLKYLVSFLESGATPTSTNAELYSGNEATINWVTIADMSSSDYVYSTEKMITQDAADSKSLTLFPAGTLLYSIYATIGKAALLMIPATINQAILAMKGNKTEDNHYLKYSLQAFEPSVRLLASGNTQFNLNAEKVNNIVLPHPSISIQKQIVTYLDRKCAEIDALIAAKEKTNALLKERRQSIIYEAVTKGLDPNAPMKDSGVEWIGEVPEGWNLTVLKRLGTPSTGSTPSKDHPEYWDGTIPWLSSKDLKADYLTDSEDHVTPQAVEQCGLTVYDANTLVFCVRSGILRHTFPVVIAKMPTTINQDLRAMTLSENACPDFILYYLKGMNDTIVTLYQKIGATVESIEMEWLNYLPVVLPPIDEQKAIARYLTDTCRSIDNIIAANDTNIEKLKEYRQSVIYEAVTGKNEI